ncbi:hypothetical protein BIW11_11172 [Tropilaelaps mercedesae]|uniref:Apolipophorins-like n=1 Tax=Tropilaelaps mercedesae TaxID=418985 RepID=A0A1V9XC87_9ACAR|nr:hypothetical protein BIW11_11172 [Tropilaelaps mercedesae]
MGPPSLAGVVSLLFLLHGGFSGPILSNEPKQCLNSLPVGRTFVYQFNGLNKIENENMNQEVSFSSEVAVSVPAPCVLSVRMRSVVSPHRKFVEALEKNPIEVHMDNGVVLDVKHDPSEPVWALNIKRAAVSMLQAPLDVREASAEVIEQDILGDCETSYTAQPTEDAFARVTKTKKLLSCQGRFKSDQAVFFTPYTAPTSDIRTIPLASGTYICHQLLSKENGVLRSAECQQKEKLYLSQQASTKPGIISTISAETSMALLREEEGANRIQSDDYRRSSLAFDHRHALENSGESLVLAMNRYCDAMRKDVRPETGKLFQDLIKSMRTASFDKILGTYHLIDLMSCDTARLKTAFLDVLGMAGSPGAVRMMAQFIENDEQAEHQQKWLASLAYLVAPTADMVEAFVPVVQKAELAQAKRVFLPVAAMANNFCKLHGERCELVPAVHRLLTSFVHKLQSGCSGERAYIVAALKAIGNLGVVAEHADSIMQCMKQEATDMRLYTLGAFRKVCQADLTNQMLGIYANQEEDPEVRIAAYLNTMRCADFDTVGKVVKVYENEKTLQVGSFVYSHMKNVQESQCPLKAALKQLIAAFPISSKFSKDPTMFSQHYEFSKFYDAANVGAAADVSLVFSPKSFLPRSAVLNLTVDVFSHSVNLLELGGRVEGLEQILEQLMGPRTAVGNAITNQLTRWKRATAEDTNVVQFDDAVKVEKPQQKMAFYVNVHGNEIDFVEFDSLQEFAAQMMSSAVNVMRYHPANFLDEVTLSGEIDIAKNAILADKRITGATISGVSLATDLRATSNVVLKASAPVPSATKETRVTLEPSAVVQIDASLTLDAGVFRHGARLATTIHTSSVVDVLIVKTDEEFRFRFNTPREKIELLNAKSEVFIIHGDYESRVEAGTTRSFDGCTIQLPEVIGMRVCLTGTVPKPWYIARRGFVKPFDIAVTIEKTDKSMEGIEIRAEKTSTKLALVFDTPGSTTDRRREFVVRRYTDRVGFQVLWQCPRKRVDLQAYYTSAMPAPGPKFMMLITDKQSMKTDEYSLSATYMDIGTVVYEANCPHLSAPATLTIFADGNALDIKSNYPMEKPLTFHAEYTKSDKNVNVVNAYLTVKGIDASAKATFLIARELLHGTLNAEYTLEGRKTEKAAYEVKVKGSAMDKGYHYNGVSTWTSTCHPAFNNKATFDLLRAGDSRKHKVQVWWGGQFRDESKTLKLNFDAKKKGSFGFGSTSTTQIFCQVFSPVFGLDWEAKYNNKVDLQRKPRITSELFVTSHNEMLVKFDFLFDRQTPQTTTRMSLIAPDTRLTSTELGKGNYKGTTDIEWGTEGKKLTIDYSAEIMSNGNHGLSMQLRAPGMKPIQHRHLIRIARDITLQTETLIDGKEYIVFEVKKEDKSLAFNLMGQMITINYVRAVNGKKVDGRLDIRSKVIYTRPIKLIIHKDSPGKRSHQLSVDLLWDAEANPDRKLSIFLQADGEDGVSKADLKIELANLINFSYKISLAETLTMGPHHLEVSISGPKLSPRILVIDHNRSPGKSETSLLYKHGDKAVIDAKAGSELNDVKRSYYLIITGAVNRKLTVSRDIPTNVITIDLDREGSLYKLVIDRKTDWSKGIVDLSITLKTPHENFGSQLFTVKGTIVDGKVDLTVNFLSGRGRNYKAVITGTRPRSMVADLQIILQTDNEKLREAKAALKYNLVDLLNSNLDLVVEAEGNRVLEFGFSLAGKSFFDHTGSLKFASKWTSSYLFDVKRTGDATNFISDATVTKDGAANYMTSHTEFVNTGDKITFQTRSTSPRGNLELAFERNKLQGDNHRTYKLNVKRNDQELKADAETQRVDGRKITSVNICQTPLEANCWSMTVERNVDISIRNSEINVKIHRKPDVTLQLQGQVSVPEGMHKVKLRLFGAINECKLGAELNCDHSTPTVSEQSLRGYIIERELLATRRREQTDKLLDIRYTAALDAKSDEKLEFAYRREFNDKGYVSNAKLSHPKMRTPIELKSQVIRGADANSIIRVESQLNWFKPEEALFLHYERRVNDETPRNRSLHIHVHKQDKSDFNLHLTMYRSEDLQKPVFAGYYWSYVTAKKETRVGRMKAYFGEDLKGYIEFASPYQGDFKITGEAKVLNAEGDKEAEIVHLKNGVETKGKISYNLQKAYMKAVILDAAGVEKREIEIDGGRREKGRYKVLLSSFPEGKKTTDLGIEHTQTSDTVTQKAKEMAVSTASKYPIEDIKEELKARQQALFFKLRKIFEDMGEYIITKVTHIFVDVQNCLTHLINNTTVGQRLKKLLEANRERILDVIDKLRAIVRKYSPKVDDMIGERLEKYLPRRSRRSVEEERFNLVMYVAERMKMFTTWLEQTTVYRFGRSVYVGLCDACQSVANAINRQIAKAKEAFLNLPDVKQIADTWAELYDSSSVGHLLPREAIAKYIIKPRLQSWRARAPVFEFDRKAGRFVADVDVPVDAKQLLQYWAYGVKSTRDEKQTSTIDAIKNSMGRLYDGHAIVIDGGHFVTFDGAHFSAAGECSYLLARDFVDGNFSVILAAGDELVYVVQIDRQFIEINVDQQTVTVNGDPVELPHRRDGVTVSRTFDKIVVEDPRTLQFTVFLSRRTAALDLRVWYFGKTAGLLGNYNREPADDLTTPSGQAPGSEQALLRSWETTLGCRSKTAVFRERSEDVESVELCQKMFNSDDSTMAFGFLLRSAHEYHDLCLRVANAATRKVDAVCRVAHAYLLDVERYGALPGYLGARLPNECRK